MKRTNLVLNEHSLEEALHLSGQKTYSAAVNLALNEYIRIKKSAMILDFQGSGIWQGDLAEMRQDQ